MSPEPAPKGYGGEARPTGGLTTRVVHHLPRRAPIRPADLTPREMLAAALPTWDDPPDLRAWRARNFGRVLRGVRRIAVAHRLGLPTFHGALWLRVLRGSGREIDLGLVGVRVVTNDGVDFIADGFTNATELETMNFHGIGTGITAENVTDSALVTELTTEYPVDNVRDTGTQSQPSANIYRSVGLNTVDENPAADMREHGLLDQAAVGGGVLLDRTLFGAIDLDANDGLETTYDLTITAGG